VLLLLPHCGWVVVDVGHGRCVVLLLVVLLVVVAVVLLWWSWSWLDVLRLVVVVVAV
jgi:hypothetical protein